MSCIVSMVTDAPVGHIYYEDSLSAREIQRYRKIIRYHSIGIGIGIVTDIVFGISVPEVTTGSAEMSKYRISFGIPSSDGSFLQLSAKTF